MTGPDAQKRMIRVADEHYRGPALILETGQNPDQDSVIERGRIWYCHLLDNCDHEMCPEDDDCIGEDCRGWYGPDDLVTSHA